MKPGPGKFERCEDLEIAERLYAITLDGGADEQDEGGGGSAWWLVADAIAFEDAEGFFVYRLYASEAEARGVWDRAWPEEHADV
jgi:hypothetical protein